MVCLLNRRCICSFIVTLLSPLSVAAVAQAQSISPADTTTTVQQFETQYQIDGGNLSGDRTSLFHSFNQFGLLTGESAQFSNPATVETIIGRVTSGDASIIDGLLSVDGSANLYLLNPSGIFFGENTQLNLSGSFSASTATGLSFGNGLLDALGTNDYGALTGAPTGYVFDAEQVSPVINIGDLAVASGQSLTLLGGQVINTGQLTAPDGEILVMAVAGERRVRLSSTGSLLELELVPLPSTQSAFAATTVPALLTGAGNLGMATDIVVNSDGTISLSGASLQIPMAGATTLISGELDSESISILGDQIALLGATVDAAGDTGGGTVLIGGDERGNGAVPNAMATVIDEMSMVRADAQDTGDGGKIVVWGNNLLRTAGQLSARGGINGGNGGFVETSSLGVLEVAIAPDVSAPNGLNGLWLLDPANIRIVAGTTNANITDTAVGGSNIFDSVGSPEQEALLGVDLILAALANGTDVEVRTTGDEPGEGNITLETPLDFDDTNGSLALLAEGAIEIQAEILDSASFFAAPFFEFPGENIDDLNLTLQANGPINIFGDIDTGRGNIDVESLQDDININSQLTTSSGDINITASQGEINVFAPILTSESRPSPEEGEFLSSFFLGGNVTIEAREAIVVDEITTSSVDQIAGNVFIQSLESTVETGMIDTSGSAASFFGDGTAGDVTLKATDNIVFSSIDASNDIGDAGNVFIESEIGTVRGTDLIPDSSATISAAGAGIDGSITIAHNGGRTNTPFDLGDAAINGTIGTLTTRAITLEDGNPNEPFLGSFEADNIEIITREAPENEVNPSIDIPGCMADCDTTNRPQDLPEGGRTTDPETVFRRFEEQLTSEVVDHLKPSLNDGESFPIFNGQSFGTADLPTVQANLLKVQNQTGKRPAIIYAVFGASDVSSDSNKVLQSTVGTDSLELLLITAQGKPKFIRLPSTRAQVLRLAQRFRRQVATPGRVNTKTYLQPAQALYQLLITPLEAELKEQNIDTISFITDAGLRSIPLAALHDGQGFIIEKYNVGLMPSLSLTDLTYQDISNVSALLAGTSAFANQTSLPGVPVELAAISSKWRGKVLQGDAFGLDMLKDERQRNPYGIIHLATHGEFNVGDLSKSYLYFHNERIRLDQLRTLGLNRPAVELLTLSACQTALGNRSAELGFAGFAVLAGAKTSVASLWNISDEASAGLMIDFYQQLQETPQIIKAEALRAAQLAMLQGKIRINDDQLLISAESRQLPIELAIKGQQDFTHPYYWAAFSLIGSPW